MGGGVHSRAAHAPSKASGAREGEAAAGKAAQLAGLMPSWRRRRTLVCWPRTVRPQ